MTKAEILAELPTLTREDRREIRARICELQAEDWLGRKLTTAEKAILDRELAEYEKNPDAGSTWEEVEARIRSSLTR